MKRLERKHGGDYSKDDEECHRTQANSNVSVGVIVTVATHYCSYRRGVLANCALGGLQLFHPFLVLCQHCTGGDDVDMVDVAVAKYSRLTVFQQVRDAHL